MPAFNIFNAFRGSRRNVNDRIPDDLPEDDEAYPPTRQGFLARKFMRGSKGQRQINSPLRVHRTTRRQPLDDLSDHYSEVLGSSTRSLQGYEDDGSLYGPDDPLLRDYAVIPPFRPPPGRGSVQRRATNVAPSVHEGDVDQMDTHERDPRASGIAHPVHTADRVSLRSRVTGFQNDFFPPDPHGPVLPQDEPASRLHEDFSDDRTISEDDHPGAYIPPETPPNVPRRRNTLTRSRRGSARAPMTARASGEAPESEPYMPIRSQPIKSRFVGDSASSISSQNSIPVGHRAAGSIRSQARPPTIPNRDTRAHSPTTIGQDTQTSPPITYSQPPMATDHHPRTQLPTADQHPQTRSSRAVSQRGREAGPNMDRTSQLADRSRQSGLNARQPRASYSQEDPVVERANTDRRASRMAPNASSPPQNYTPLEQNRARRGEPEFNASYSQRRRPSDSDHQSAPYTMHKAPDGYTYYIIPEGSNVVFVDVDGNEITRVGDFGDKTPGQPSRTHRPTIIPGLYGEEAHHDSGTSGYRPKVIHIEPYDGHDRRPMDWPTSHTSHAEPMTSYARQSQHGSTSSRDSDSTLNRDRNPYSLPRGSNDSLEYA